mmetsp:Transcript_62002/g.115080  ORF Transcript_62002/g.115080 Transcript_62002/m.115080 type:complete len:104 (-) Transcript_62002:874-1185(-)
MMASSRCLLVASALVSCVHAYRHESEMFGQLSAEGAGGNATFPGGGCSLEECCKRTHFQSMWDNFYKVAKGSEPVTSFNFADAEVKELLRCGLLAAAVPAWDV